MAVIDQADVTGFVLTDDDVSGVKSVIRYQIWQWYHQHQEDVVVKRWFFTVHVRDLYSLFELIAGHDTVS